MSNIVTLRIGNNQFTGGIPAALGQMENLEVMALENNDLAGEIPAELGRLSQLTILELSQNKLTGVPPSELGSLLNLSTLQLANNAQMIGPLPGSYTNLDLFNLNLDGTNLCIPASPEFQTWIEGIDNGAAATCADPEIEVP